MLAHGFGLTTLRVAHGLRDPRTLATPLAVPAGRKTLPYGLAMTVGLLIVGVVSPVARAWQTDGDEYGATNMRRIIRRVRGIRSERGAALVEFALVVPFLMMMMCATIDFGLAVYTLNNLTAAVREGGRFAAVVEPDWPSGGRLSQCTRPRLQLHRRNEQRTHAGPDQGD